MRILRVIADSRKGPVIMARMSDKERGIHRTNQEFSEYDQVDKPQEYRLSEHAGEHSPLPRSEFAPAFLSS